MALILLLGLALLGAAEYRRFDGDKVLRCSFDFTQSEHKRLYQSLLDEDRDEANFWAHTDIHVTPKSISRISSALDAAGVNCTVYIEDVQALVDAERVPAKPEPGAPNPDPFFNTYPTLDQLNAWYANQSRTFSSLIFNYTRLNTSYEGRDIMITKITNGTANSKPIIFIEGGIHAREWIAHMTTAYLLGKLTSGWSSDADAVALLNKFELHFVGCVNPDGYAYTWNVDRMWRKTRKPNTGSTCIGTDPNRNWDDHWCQVGASTNPCSDSYCGSAAFTERETRSMGNHITSTNRMRMFIDLHAYGQLWMAPYGWSGATPPDGTAQRNIGTTATAAIRSNSGLTYNYGTIYNIIYPASGSSADYGYDVGKVIYSYGVELRDTGTNGFTLPASQIRPQGEEIWAALVAMGRQL